MVIIQTCFARTSAVVLLTLVLTDGALETQSDVMGPNNSTGEQKSAEKQVAKTLHEGCNFYKELDGQFAGYTHVVPELAHVEQEALTPLTTPQQIRHHPPFIEANASIFCMHDVPMQEQENCGNCFLFGFDGIWTYDRVFKGFPNFVPTRYGFPFSHLQTSEISSDGETPKFDKMTAAVTAQNSNFETVAYELNPIFFTTDWYTMFPYDQTTHTPPVFFLRNIFEYVPDGLPISQANVTDNGYHHQEGRNTEYNQWITKVIHILEWMMIDSW